MGLAQGDWATALLALGRAESLQATAGVDREGLRARVTPLRQAAESRKREYEQLVAQARAELVAAGSPPVRAAAAYRLAQTHQAYGRQDLAIAAYAHPALASSQYAGQAQAALAELHLARGEWAMAETAVAAGVSRQPDHPASPGWLGLLLREPGTRAGTIGALLAKVAKDHPKTAAGRAAGMLRGSLLARAGKRDQALGIWREALAAQDDLERARTLRLMVGCFRLPQEADRARVVLTGLQGKGCGCAATLVLAELEGRCGRPAQAWRGYQQVASKWPTSPLATQARLVLTGDRHSRYVAVTSALGSGSPEQAKRQLMELCQDRKTDPALRDGYLLQAVQFCDELGQGEEAQRYLRTLMAEGADQDTRAWAQLELGSRLLAWGKPEEAARLVQPLAGDEANPLCRFAKRVLEQCQVGK